VLVFVGLMVYIFVEGLWEDSVANQDSMSEEIRRETSHIGVSCYRLVLEAIDRIELPRLNKGITLRGAFGTVFRRLVCHDTDIDCRECSLHRLCPYGAIFTPVVPLDAERLRLNRDIPRPFVIKPPLEGDGLFDAGDVFSFDFVVVGSAAGFLPYFIVTFEELGRAGIGVRRGRFKVARIQAMAGSGGFRDIYDAAERVVRPPDELFFPGRCEDFLTESKNTLTVIFNTPVLLKERGKWVEPDFGALIKRLRDRLCALSYFYCGKTVELDYRKVGKAAQSVEVVDAGLHWVEESRYARHRNLWHFLKGYIGSITYQGDIEPFMPMLRLGEFVHVGKSTAFGQGWYTIKE
jgi:hypothetical protein